MKLQNKLLSMVAIAAIYTHSSLLAQEIIEPTGLDQINEIIASDARIEKKVSPEDILKAQKSASSMNALIKEAIIARGLANDGFISISDTREINSYLLQNYSNEWYELRGQEADEESTGFYLVNRRGIYSSTTVMNQRATQTWSHIYNLGFQPTGNHNNRLSDYTGSKASSFTTVGYTLGEIMKDDVVNGSLDNPEFKKIEGTTNTALDSIIKAIMNDQGLIRKISTGDIREGSKNADAMNHLIIEAIIEEGLGNDGELTTADIRQINNYLVANYKDRWAELHGDDEEDGEETGYHLVQNDGAYSRMFADNVVNNVADGIYHLGFETDNKYRLLNEDGNANKSFEKVAWWLDTILKDDLEAGTFNNDNYQEVQGTTGTTFDGIIPYIYHESNLLLRVSMEAIRTGARSANGMNELIVEAIKNTNVADDNYISVDDVKAINSYLVTNHRALWAELHGDDEDDGTETGYHVIQNNGARGTAYGKNLINNLADGIYHLGFETTHKSRLVNEDGNNNVSFKSVAYWLNRSLQDDFDRGAFK